VNFEASVQRALLPLVLATAVLMASTEALADGAPTAAALFVQARRDAAAGDYEQACPRFAESLRLAPAVGTMLNLGDCEEHRGHLADALEQFRHALESLPDNDDRVRFARERIAKLTPRVPHVRLHEGQTPPQAIEVDGVKLGSAAMGVPLPLNPGDHAVVAHAPGRQDRTYAVRVAEGTNVDLTVAAGDAPPAREAARPPPPQPAPATTSGTARTIGWASLIVGGVGVGVGAVTGIVALDLAAQVKDRCSSHVCPSQSDVEMAKTGSTSSTVSTVGFGVGIVGVALGAVLLLRGDHGPGARASTQLSPVVGPRTAGVLLSASFD
jgi:hypothetical protein